MLQMMLALLVSFLIVLLMGPKFIPYMHKLHFGQTIYELGPQHKAKQGTKFLFHSVLLFAGNPNRSILFPRLSVL